MGDNANKNKRKIYAIIVAAALFVVVVVVFSAINLMMSATLDIVVTPLSAEIKINGKVYQNGIYKCLLSKSNLF